AHDYVQEHSVDPRPLLDGIAQGLLYLHTYEQGPIIHGNLKGSNVLVSPEGRALVTDFGLSPVLDSSLLMSFGISHGRSLNWMPPEYVNDGGVTAKGDVWAFGMTVLELFTRKAPFHDCQSMAAVVLAIVKGPPNRPNVEDTYYRFTDGWWDLCCSCWNRDVLLRPPISDVLKRIPLHLSGAREISSGDSNKETGDRQLQRQQDQVQPSPRMSIRLRQRRELMINTSEIKCDDKVILVLGSSGSGMSNFINKLTGMEPEPGAGALVPCTRDIYAYACDSGGQRFVFVDTPGFDGTISESTLLRELAAFLKMTYGMSIILTGIVYTRRITDDYSSRVDAGSIQLLSALCGNEAANCVRLITTMWDEIDEKSAAMRENDLKDSLWRSLLTSGACYERFNNTFDAAWDIVRGHGDTRKALLLQKELVDEGLSLEDTTLGREFQRTLESFRLRTFPSDLRPAIDQVQKETGKLGGFRAKLWGN
ncbi:hypothetical protein ID866_10712, partial [Astraeus odoratus]